ncbi:MAG TPA: hypothetical protein VER08_07925, partial [Pyrinomonadaceae bacterium]|nr:hypothetical protein [Pyrinomonadaceae bacterium]
MKSLLLFVAAVVVVLAGLAAFVTLRRGGPAPVVSDLARAAERGDDDALRALIAAGADVNARDHAFTPLI